MYVSVQGQSKLLQIASPYTSVSNEINITPTVNFSGGMPLQNHKIYSQAERLNTNAYIYVAEKGKKMYEINDHLGNVRVVVSDRKIAVESTTTPGTIDHFEADVLATYDYYPMGGMLMPGRNFNPTTSRYMYQGQESDNEIYGSPGTAYSYKFRMSNSRIGGDFWSPDAKGAMFPGVSPYSYLMNSFPNAVDLDGKVVIFVNGFWGTGTGASDGGTAKHWGSNWIKGAQKAIGDNQARFYDGSSDWTGKVGGTSRISWNFDAKNRYQSGYMQGVRDAADIVNSLETDEHGNITESIKFVTSSMGAAYSRGLSQGIVDYVAAQNKEIDTYNTSLEKNADGSYVDASLVKKHLNVVIESTTDLDAFQPSQVGADPNSDNNYYMKSGSILGGDVPGSTEIGNTNMGGHHPSWAPAKDLPKGKMNPSTSGKKENPTE